MALVSMREYAKHRAVSHTAVQKAVKAGHLVNALVETESGKMIDSVQADTDWHPKQALKAQKDRLCSKCGRPVLT